MQNDRAVSPAEIISYLKLPNVNSTLARRNAQLIEEVRKRGVDFSLQEVEKELREAGANNALIEAIRKKSLPTNPTPTNPIKQIQNPLGMEFVLIPSGWFTMGSLKGADDEKPVHKVTINYEFYMGKYEVTIGEWKKVMGDLPQELRSANAKFKESDLQPVIYVSWFDAKEFVAKMNAKNDGFEYRLPSEAEWEYACRAGTTTEFAFGNSLGLGRANYNDNYPYPNNLQGPNPEKTVEVKSYRPNAWGLYNMHGNVWEWVEDIYNPSYTGLPTDGTPNLTIGDPKARVLRGGSWLDVGSGYLRSAIRNSLGPSARLSGGVGIRLVARAN